MYIWNYFAQLSVNLIFWGSSCTGVRVSLNFVPKLGVHYKKAGLSSIIISLGANLCMVLTMGRALF